MRPDAESLCLIHLVACLPRADQPEVGSVGGNVGGVGPISGAAVGAIQRAVVGGVAVAPDGRIAWGIQGTPPVEVTVDNADVTGVRLVLPVRRP
jgi:hypothetical protein